MCDHNGRRSPKTIPPKPVAFFNYSAQMGGAEHSLVLFLKHLNREKIRPFLFHTERGPLVDQVRSLNIPCRFIPLGFDVAAFRRGALWLPLCKSPMLLLKACKWAKSFRCALREENIACVHANQPKSHLLTMLAVPHSMPYVLHLRDMFEAHTTAKLFYRLFFSKSRGHAVAISRAVARAFPKNVRRTIRVIYNGVEVPPNEKVERKPDLDRICAISRIVPWKGLDLLIRAFGHIAPHFPQAVLTIAGSPIYWNPAYQTDLEKLAQNLNLGATVEFIGYQKDVYRVLHHSEFLVLPSEKEPFGRVLIEAMAYQRPVIAFRTGGVPEIVEHEKTGLLVEKRTEADLARAMEWMLCHKEQARAMGKAGRQKAESLFFIDQHVRQMEQLFSEILFPNTGE